MNPQPALPLRSITHAEPEGAASSSPQPGRLILVTSARHGEGVTTVTRRLALGLRMDDALVIVVDANLRPATNLTGTLRTGLAEAIQANDAPERYIRAPRVGEPHILAAGRGCEHPPALFNSARFASLLEALRARYRWILMDAPPVIPYPDAAVLAPQSDGVVLVVRAESTRAQVVGEAERILRRAGGRPIGAVLNRRRHHIPAWLYKRL